MGIDISLCRRGSVQAYKERFESPKKKNITLKTSLNCRGFFPPLVFLLPRAR